LQLEKFYHFISGQIVIAIHAQTNFCASKIRGKYLMGCGICLPVPEKYRSQLNFCFKEGRKEEFLPLEHETDFG